MVVSVFYMLRTWGWDIPMLLVFLCAANFGLSDSQVIQLCPGQSAELSCTVAEQDSLIWNGTAFTDQCPSASEPDTSNVTRGDIDSDANPTTILCGRFRAVNRFINTTVSNFPGQEFMAIESNISFVINDTTLSGNVNILCNAGLQDIPQENVTINLHDITPRNLLFVQSTSSQNFYWSVDNEAMSECNLMFTVTIMSLSAPGFSPLIIPTADSSVNMACDTLNPGVYEFSVSSTSGTVMARSSPYQFSVSDTITGVEISNIMCDSATITFIANTRCDMYPIVAELRDASCQEAVASSVSGSTVYHFSDLEQGATYCVCARILYPADGSTICGNDLPENNEFTTLSMTCSGSVCIPHYFILVVAALCCGFHLCFSDVEH